MMAKFECMPDYTGADLGILRGGGGGFWAGILRGGVRVQVHGNFHILTRKKRKKTLRGGGVKPPTPHPLDPPLLHMGTQWAPRDKLC